MRAAPYATVGNAVLLLGDAREPLPLADGSVHCVVTSPPYWGLRDYGTATWVGGDPACDHRGAPLQSSSSTLSGNGHGAGKPLSPALQAQAVPVRGSCRRCGAVRVDRQLGLEATPEEYVANMVQVFREVRRVLRDDGTLWLNIGDSFAVRGTSVRPRSALGQGDDDRGRGAWSVPAGLKEKDLVGIPWMLAFALRADGWYLRSDIIWSKPNPMPESVTDRPTKAHEYLFLLTKRPTYFYDAEAVKEQTTGTVNPRGRGTHPKSAAAGRGVKQNGSFSAAVTGVVQARNRRSAWTEADEYATWAYLFEHADQPTAAALQPLFHQWIEARALNTDVWTVATQPFTGAHFAVFPPELIRPCIQAGTSARGCCPACGAAWVRVMERVQGQPDNYRGSSFTNGKTGAHQQGRASNAPRWTAQTIGWEPSCACPPAAPIPCTVLDPFNGAATTGVVALQEGRSYVGRDINPSYLEMSAERLRLEGAGPLFAAAPEPPPAAVVVADLFTPSASDASGESVRSGRGA